MPNSNDTYKSYKSGILIALIAALISGVSVYVNKLGVSAVPNPFVFTTSKNTFVALAFLTFLGAKGFKELRSFSPKQWFGWLALGLVGGGIPFLLFFKGLSLTSAANSALIQKSLFLWVAVLAIPFLKEKFGWWQAFGLTVLALGQILLQPAFKLTWGTGENLVLLATVLWAAETVLAKKLMLNKLMSSQTAALGRMGVGAAVMWVYLFATGQADEALGMGAKQWFWIAVTSAFLAAYVGVWYKSLKLAPATTVASLLTLGALITIVLTVGFDSQVLTLKQVLAGLFLATGATMLVFGSNNKKLAALS